MGRSMGQERGMGHTKGGSMDKRGGVDKGTMSNSGSRSVGRDSGVGDLGNVAAVSVGGVGDGLGPAVGQGHGVGAGGGVAVTVLLLAEVGAAVVVVDGVLVGVDRGLVVHGLGGVLANSGGDDEGEDDGDLKYR